MGIETDIGQIIRILYIPCATTPKVWLLAAGNPAMKAYWSFREPVVKTEIKMVTKKSWVKIARQLLEDAEEALPEAVEAGGMFLLDIAEVVDASLWYLFLAGLAADFLFDWCSAVWTMEGCDPNKSVVLLNADTPRGALFEGDAWQVAGIWIERQPSVDPYRAPEVYVPPFNFAWISFHMQWTGFLGSPRSDAEMRVVNVLTGEEVLRANLSEYQFREGNALGHARVLKTSVLGAYLRLEWRGAKTGGSNINVPTYGHISIGLFAPGHSG